MPKNRTRKKVSKDKNTGSGQQSPPDQLLSCLGQLVGWLDVHQRRLDSALAGYEQQQPGCALWQDFSLCLTSMHAPVTPSDLALLKSLLDPQHSGLVDVTSLHSDLVTHTQELSLARTVPREGELCAICGLRLPPPSHDPCLSYVDLHMLLAPFASSPSHPGHVSYLLPTSTTIHTLQHQLLHSTLGAMATAVAVFSEVTVQPSSRLLPHSSLMEVGVAGGRRTTPTKATLYYDYIPLSIECPVLMADHHSSHDYSRTR